MPRDDHHPETTAVASVEEIRSHFPALERVHNGVRVAYFDGPGGTQVPTPVVEAMKDYLFNHNANTHWEYPTSNETDDILEHSRQTLADLLNCSSDEVAFGQNMTSLTFHLSRALGRRFESGDEIIVTELDHHANSDPWRELAKDRGLKIRVLPMNVETGTLELEQFPDLLNQRTRLVAIGAASNILGTINPIREVCALARKAGALSFVDAVHYAAHELIDVREIGCDFLAVSAYKFYGPHIGAMYVRRQLLDLLDFPKLRPAPDYSPDRMETGTQNHEGIAGAAAAVDFLASLAHTGNPADAFGRSDSESPAVSRRERLAIVFAELHRRQTEMFGVLWNGLSNIPRVKLYGPPPGSPRTSTVSFSVEGFTSDEVALRLADRGLFLSDGDFYALTVVEKIAAGGLVRAGLACYTTMDEVQRLIDGVREIVTRR